jgi:hypothetical protein
MFEWCNEKTNNKFIKKIENNIEARRPLDLSKADEFITNVKGIQPITQYQKNLVQIWL